MFSTTLGIPSANIREENLQMDNAAAWRAEQGSSKPLRAFTKDRMLKAEIEVLGLWQSPFRAG